MYLMWGKTCKQECPLMFTCPVRPVELCFYWPEAIFGNFYWPGASISLLVSSPAIRGDKNTYKYLNEKSNSLSNFLWVFAIPILLSKVSYIGTAPIFVHSRYDTGT